MSEVTYGRLDEVLRSLGFTVRKTDENALFYEHAATGALIAIPDLPKGEEVFPRHLLAARAVLDTFGISDPMTFTAKLQKAS
jgi:hypothetical protein